VARPVDFKGSNIVLRPPAGSESSMQTLPIFRNGSCCVSCWELSSDEIEEITRTGRVYLSVFSGATQPPVYVGSETRVRDMVADTGVWKR